MAKEKMDLNQMASDGDYVSVDAESTSSDLEQGVYDQQVADDLDVHGEVGVSDQLAEDHVSGGGGEGRSVDEYSQSDAEDELYEHGDGEESERDQSSIFGRVLAVGQSLVLLASLGVSSYALYGLNETRSNYVSLEQMNGYARVADLNQVGMDVTALSDALQGLEISSRLDFLETANSVVREDLDFLRGGLGDVAENRQRMESMTRSVDDIQSALSGIDFVRKVELQDVNDRISGVQVGVLKLSDRMQELELSRSSQPVPGVIDAESKSAVSEVVIKQTKPSDVRYSIGALRVEDFIRYADRYLIVLGDGVSGTVQLVAGNRLGRYVIDRVDEDSARVLDTLTSKKFTLKKELQDD